MIAVALLLWLLVAAVIVLAVRAAYIEPNRLDIVEISVPLPGLPAELAGLTIGHLSDTHLGTPRASRHARRAAQAMLKLEPDVICVTGDVVNDADYLEEGAQLLRSLHAPLGIFVVLGNHDCNATMEHFLAGVVLGECAEEQWKQAVAGSAVHILDNEWREVEYRGCRVVLAGIGDVSAGRDDLPRALRDTPPADLRILLSHTPDALDLRGADWANLVLAGHTHGGQFQLPGLGSVWAPVWRWRHRAAGLMRMNHTVAFVTHGVGAGISVRLNCPPQVAVLTLQPGDPDHLPETPAPDVVRRGHA